MAGAPTGTVTFLFTDVEGCTARWERSPAAVGVALARHEDILKEILEAHSDYVFKTVEKALCCAFAAATEVLEVALPQEQAEEARKTPAGPRRCGEGVASALLPGNVRLRDIGEPAAQKLRHCLRHRRGQLYGVF